MACRGGGGGGRKSPKISQFLKSKLRKSLLSSPRPSAPVLKKAPLGGTDLSDKKEAVSLQDRNSDHQLCRKELRHSTLYTFLHSSPRTSRPGILHTHRDSGLFSPS